MKLTQEERDLAVIKARKVLEMPEPNVINKEMFHKVANRLLNERVMKEVGYNQGTWCRVSDIPNKRDGCGTAACIAGHTVLEHGFNPQELAYLEDTNVVGYSPIRDMAQRLLGLDEWEADNLFNGDGDWADVEFSQRFQEADSDWNESRVVAAEYLTAIANGEAEY